MRKINESISVNAGPDAVWAITGDLGGVADWIPAIAKSRLDGDIRHVTFEGGGDARERIVAVDDAARTYTYEYLDGPLALEEYQSTLTVEPDGAGSTITWTAKLTAGSPAQEQELSEAIAGIYSSALIALTALLDAPA